MEQTYCNPHTRSPQAHQLPVTSPTNQLKTLNEQTCKIPLLDWSLQWTWTVLIMR